MSRFVYPLIPDPVLCGDPRWTALQANFDRLITYSGYLRSKPESQSRFDSMVRRAASEPAETALKKLSRLYENLEKLQAWHQKVRGIGSDDQATFFDWLFIACMSISDSLLSCLRLINGDPLQFTPIHDEKNVRRLFDGEGFWFGFNGELLKRWKCEDAASYGSLKAREELAKYVSKPGRNGMARTIEIPLALARCIADRGIGNM